MSVWRRVAWPWPLRARLTAAFVVGMAVVLTIGGGFVYLRLGDSLDNAITLGLKGRADDLASGPAASGVLAGRSQLTEAGESIAQRLSADGKILDATPAIRDHVLLTQKQISRALDGREVLVDREATPAGDDPVRLLAVRVDGAGGRSEVLVVGTSTDTSQEALQDAGELMLLGAPFVLLLSSLAGHMLAGAALRPVERMRRQAEAIQATDPGQRLEVPVADDEIRRLGLTLNDLLERLEVAVEVERTFVADASHELRTPLAILKAELEYALRPARTSNEHVQALQLAADETDRLVRLAEDLLVIARAQGGELALRSEPVDIVDVVATVVERHRRAAEGRGVTLQIGEVTTAPDLQADRLRLEQAIGNLIDNAITHAASKVEISIDQQHGELKIVVSDDGDGFPPEFVSHAFERFTRADKARTAGGSGLGLSIVDAIATAHGGRAEAANDPPHGARVAIRLPASPENRRQGGADARADR